MLFFGRKRFLFATTIRAQAPVPGSYVHWIKGCFRVLLDTKTFFELKRLHPH